MSKRKTPKYLKILEGMNACYGGTEERGCSRCPYDKYNDTGFYGESGANCMLKLNEDAKKWAESMEMFTNCGDCVCFSRNRDENGEWRFTDGKETDGYCSVWHTMMEQTEYCSRGAMKD